MPLSCKCKKDKTSRDDATCIIFFLRCQRQYSFLGFVVRNASLAQLQNCLVTMALYFFNGASANTPILGTTSVFTPLENPRLTVVDFGKTLVLYSTRHYPRFYAQTSTACLSYARMAFVLSWCNQPLFSVETMQNDIWIMLQNVMLSILALRVLPSPTFQEYITCFPRNSARTLNQWTASSTPSRPRWHFGEPVNIVHMKRVLPLENIRRGMLPQLNPYIALQLWYDCITQFSSCCYCSNQRPVVCLANQPGYTNRVPVDGKINNYL